MQRLSISVPDEMDDWLTENRINKSKFFQEAVRKEQQYVLEKGKNPLLFVVCTGLFVMGVTLILVSFLPFLSFEVKIFLPLLGGILSFVSVYSFFRENKKLKSLEGQKDA